MIHIGPNAQQIDKFVERPQSKVRPKGKRSNQKEDHWVSDYPMIDAGRSRRERNNEIVNLNLERASRSKDFETRAWAQYEKEQQALDRNLENTLIPQARRRTLEERRIRQEFKEKLDTVRKTRDADLKLVKNWTRQKYAPALSRMDTQQSQEINAYDKNRKAFWNRLWSGLSPRFRQKQEQTKADLLNRHRAARKAFRRKYRDEVEKQTEAVQQRANPKYEAIKRDRRTTLSDLRKKQREPEKEAELLWQNREIVREQESRILEKAIADWKRMQKKRVNERGHDQDHGRERSRDRGRGPK